MSAHTQVRLASITAAAYGVLFVSGIVHRFQRTGSFERLVDSLSQPVVWITLLIAAIVTFGLWKRYAWAWWVAIAAAAYQLFRIGEMWYAHAFRLPGIPTLIALVLLVVLLVLLLPRRSRLACSR